MRGVAWREIGWLLLVALGAAAMALLILGFSAFAATGHHARGHRVHRARPTDQPAPDAALTFTNPVLGQGEDPSVVVAGGWYYFTQTSPDMTYLTVRRARSLKSLAAAPKTVVWQGGRDGSPCCEWWAPELHHLNGSWFIYTTADDGNNDHHRLQVLQAPTPLGPYTYKGKLTTPGDHWSIDPSPLRLSHGRLYLFWSGWPDDVNGVQNIYVAQMSNPWTITGDRTLLSTPTFPWETQSGTVPVKVNESPEPIVHAGKVSVSYSGSGCWTPDYALGLLSAGANANLLDPAVWTKSPQPILHSNAPADIYGPASNGWFTSPDGRETWTVFHAVNDSNGNCGLERNVYAQPVTWNADGTPALGGQPVSLTTPLRVPSGDPGAP